jgi:hypothetical protein
MQSRANRNPATRYQRRANLRIAENQDLRRPQGEPHFLGCCEMVDVCEDLDVFLIQPNFSRATVLFATCALRIVTRLPSAATSLEFLINSWTSGSTLRF